MRHRSWPATLAILILGCLTAAAASPMEAPHLEPGKHVYLVPPVGWMPQGFNPVSLNDLDALAAKLHYPFYVVISKDVPSSAEALDALVVGLIQDWTATPGFDVSTTSVAVLGYEPKKKFTLQPAARWVHDLGLNEASAREPFMELFNRSARATPKDPAGGLRDVLSGLDEFAWDRTDPARAAERKAVAEAAEKARAKAEEQAQIARAEADKVKRHDELHAGLMSPIDKLEGLLAKDRALLPKDLTKYQDALKSAKSALERDDDAGMTTALAALDPYVEKLAALVANAESARDSAIFLSILSWLASIGAIVFCAVILGRRHHRLGTARADFDDMAREWDQRVINGMNQYVTFQDRADVVRLAGATGATKALYDEVTAGIDEMMVGLRALQAYVAACRTLAATGSFWNLEPLDRAGIGLVSGEVSYDTGKENLSDLFNPETQFVKQRIRDLSYSLSNRFRDGMSGWLKLKQAVEVATGSLDELAKSNLEALRAKCVLAGIPERWLHQHPLWDVAALARLDDLRVTDPVSAMAEAEHVQVAQKALASTIASMIDALSRIKRVSHATVPPDLVLAETDDPIVALAHARAEDVVLRGVLDNGVSTDQVIKAAYDAFTAYDEVRKREAQAASVSQGLVQARAEADKALDAAAVILAEAELKGSTPQANENHTLGDLRDALKKAQDGMARARALLDTAVEAEGQHRLVDALRGLGLAEAQAGKVRGQAKDILEGYAELERAKAAYEAKAKEIPRLLERQTAALQAQGSHARGRTLRPYQPVDYVVDHAAALLELKALERAWASDVSQASQAREDADAAGRRSYHNRTSYSSPSYSSGSSSYGSSGRSSDSSSYGSSSSSSDGGSSSSSSSSSSWGSDSSSSSSSSSDSSSSSSSSSDW